MKTIIMLTVFVVGATILSDALSWGSWLRGFACGIVAACWVTYLSVNGRDANE